MKRSLKLNPKNVLATWADIKAKRNELEQAPLTVFNAVYDADEISVKRMELAIIAFDDLPTLNNGKLTWKKYDNTFIELTQAELQTLYDTIKVQLAKRSARLHYQAVMIAQKAKTIGELDDLTLWGVASY